MNSKRPDSSQLADLHVYILPTYFWKDSQNLAFNEVIRESVSLGFIRANRECKLIDLRDELRTQLAPGDVPKDFIFLKSVGRALTRVRCKQENELKVKNFIPPQSQMPEIFILECRCEPKVDNSSTYRINELVLEQETTVYEPYLTVVETPYVLTKVETVECDKHLKNGSRRNIQFQCQGPEKINEKDLLMLKEEQERLRLRQAELEMMRNRQMDLEQSQNGRSNKDDSDSNDYYDSNSTNNNNNNNRNGDSNSDDERGEREREEAEEQRRERELNEERDATRKHEEEEESERKRNREREMYEDSAVKIQSFIRGHHDRKKFNNRGSTNLKFSNAESIDDLKDKLEDTRLKRNEVEMLRNELIRNLKLLHNRITVRRKEARDLWKKKYFAEKKKTPALEDKIQSQLNEINSLQRKMFSNLETEIRNAALGGYVQESESRNNLLNSLKLQEEIYSYKRQVDQAKLKLTTDIKLRNQAETESKALRTELIQTKMNLHQLKSH